MDGSIFKQVRILQIIIWKKKKMLR